MNPRISSLCPKAFQTTCFEKTRNWQQGFKNDKRVRSDAIRSLVTKAKPPGEQLVMALPSSRGTVSPFSHRTRGSAEVNAKSLLKGFVAVALKKEIKHLFLQPSAVQRSKGRQSKRSSEKHRSDGTRVFSKITLFLNVNRIFLARNC